VGRVRVALGLAECVMLAMQISIATWVQVGATLAKKGHQMEKALPSPAHCEHRVRTVAVQEEVLAEDAQHPVGHKEDDNLKHRLL